jgi:Mg-chelatase subunit ChlD
MTQHNNPSPDTHIVVLLDRSGSMESIAPDVIGGYNRFIAEQRENGADAKVTLVQFDSKDPHEVIHEAISISAVPRLTEKNFIPRASTPLLDATGQLIAKIRERQALDSRRPDEKDEIVFVTITDGEENQSREYTLAQTREMIANCEKDGWTFVFLSAGLDAYGEAHGMGVSSGKTRAFRATKDGTEMAFSALSMNMSALRDKKRRNLDTSNDDFFDDATFDRILGDD